MPVPPPVLLAHLTRRPLQPSPPHASPLPSFCRPWHVSVLCGGTCTPPLYAQAPSCPPALFTLPPTAHHATPRLPCHILINLFPTLPPPPAPHILPVLDPGVPLRFMQLPLLPLLPSMAAAAAAAAATAATATDGRRGCCCYYGFRSRQRMASSRWTLQSTGRSTSRGRVGRGVGLWWWMWCRGWGGLVGSAPDPRGTTPAAAAPLARCAS